MEYFKNLFKKAIESIVVTTVLIVFLWGTLYHLTNYETVAGYIATGILVCFVNALLYNLFNLRLEKIFFVRGLWVIVAGLVLLLYHAGFTTAAIFAAAVTLSSPFLGASIYESIVGLSLLIKLAYMI